jgi:hypothetical protein
LAAVRSNAAIIRLSIVTSNSFWHWCGRLRERRRGTERDKQHDSQTCHDDLEGAA